MLFKFQRKIINRKSLFFFGFVVFLMILFCTIGFGEETPDEYCNNASIEINSEESAEMFLHNLFYPQSKVSRGRVFSGDNLSGNAKTIYNFLVEKIDRISKGLETDTEFFINIDDCCTMYYADELGIISFGKSGRLSDEGISAINEAINSEVRSAVEAVKSDYVDKLFWVGNQYEWNTDWNVVLNDSGTIASTTYIRINLKLYVGSEYRLNGNELKFNSNLIHTADNAVSFAHQIVASCAGKTDIEKLRTYKEKICSMVEYDNSAWGLRDDGTTGILTDLGSPWQIVWVFDNDPETNVVCEGYARAFKYLCEISNFNSDISAICVDGRGHMWNVVKMGDGQNYLADITWCDSGSDLFLVGYTTGSYDTGYTFVRSEDTYTYTYYDYCKQRYSRNQLEICNHDYKEPTSSTTLEFRNVIYPKTFRIDTTNGWFLQGGTVVSDVELTSIQSIITRVSDSTVIEDGDTGEIPITSGKTFSQFYKLSDFDKKVKFSNITIAGDYVWTLIAKDSQGRTLRMVMPFTAVDDGTTETDTRSLTYPNSDPESSQKPESVEIVCYESPMFDEVYQYRLEDYAEVPLMGASFPNNVEVAWESSDPSVAIAPTSESIYMKIVGPGTAVIKCYCVDYPDVFAKFTVEVTSDSKPSVEFIDNGGVPTGNLPKGQSFELRGVVSASENIQSITGTIYDANSGEVVSGIGTNPITINPNSTLVDIYPSQINTSLKFSNLDDGAYRYELVVTTVSGVTKIVADSTFIIFSTDLAEDISIDAAHFPDDNFRAYVAENIDTDGNGVLSKEERNAITRIDVSHQNIASLQGIELFSALRSLDCYDNQLTSLDVSGNPALHTLNCSGNQLTSLDVSGNPALNYLYCDGNQLTSLDVNANPDLFEIICSGNQLISLDVSGNPTLDSLYCEENQLTNLNVNGCAALTWLYCQSNQLTSLNMSGNLSLRELWCYENQLSSLDVSNCTALTTLHCGENQLTSLDVSGNLSLQKLYCYYNQLTNLDVSGNPALQMLSCHVNQLTSLNVNGNPALQKLSCYRNQLTNLDVSRNPALQTLTCYENQLTSLNVGANLVLEELYCFDNQLSSLNVNGCTALTVLECYENQLASLNMSGCTAMQTLYCYENQLKSLDMNNKAALQKLGCSDNQLTELNLNGCISLTWLNCGNNQLTSLNVNGISLQTLYCFGNRLTSLDVNANPSIEDFACEGNQRTITAENGQFDLSTLPGFDIAKTSNWKGGTVSGTILTVPASGNVTYTYDCGNGYSETFTLNVTVTGESETEILPGDINRDGVVDGRDLLRLAKYLAGQDVVIDEKAADLNGDGKVDGRDVLRLAKQLAGN